MSSMANGNALEKYRGVPEARDASRVATGRLRPSVEARYRRDALRIGAGRGWLCKLRYEL